MKRFSIAVFCLYVLWCGIALLEIVLRKYYGHSPLPGILANHNGNIAVSGYILAAAYPGALLQNAARKWDNQLLHWLALAVVPAAGVLWGSYFILMEVLPALGGNVEDWRDIPGSVFGVACGIGFGIRFQQRICQWWKPS